MTSARSILILALLALPAFVSAGQTEIPAKLGKAAATLAAAYKASPGAKESPKTAVFTFSCPQELEKRRVGFAVSEIFSHHLAKGGVFRLVERTELNRVLEELKFGMSGVTEQADAVKAGRLASAELLVLGSVEKLGSSYHVNARLVNAGTGEVTATAYVELPVTAFETEARDYITLVPKTQSIGVYFIYARRAVSATDTQTETISSCGSSGCITTLTSKDAAFWAPGIGLHYTPVEKWAFDAAFLASAASDKTGTIDINVTGSGTSRINYEQKYSMIRLLAGRDLAIGEKVSLYLAAGGTAVQLSGEGDANYITPTFYARAEYHPQQRFSVSISTGYDLKTKAGRGSDYAPSSFKVSELKNFYIEPAVAIHF